MVSTIFNEREDYYNKICSNKNKHPVNMYDTFHYDYTSYDYMWQINLNLNLSYVSVQRRMPAW